MEFIRYALYYAPPEGAGWAQFATRWLGWDTITGRETTPPALTGLPASPTIAEITQTPRKYGLHGTIKPPFHLAPGHGPADLEQACTHLCQTLTPVRLNGLTLTRLGRFLALCPSEPNRALGALAAACVRGLDVFRAPPSEGETAKRRAAHLSPRQQDNLTRWGYPYVMDDFRFHITLTGRLTDPQLAVVQTALNQALTPLLPEPCDITDLALAGQGQDGRFHLIRRFALAG